jgi:hypothetical protein
MSKQLVLFRLQWKSSIQITLSWSPNLVLTPGTLWYDRRPSNIIVPEKKLIKPSQNWPITRKYVILAVLCLASFSGAIAPLSGQLNLADQEKLYNKTKLEESYAVCLQLPLQSVYYQIQYQSI